MSTGDSIPHSQSLSQDVNTGDTSDQHKVYSLLPLIQANAITGTDGGDSVEVTCIESLDQSIYIGTSSGEILHFFRADGGLSDGDSSMPSYIIASKQKTYNKKQRSVNQILLLPPVSRALILSGNKTSVFTLPEFAPKSEVGSMKDVNSLSRDIDTVDRQKAQIPPVTSSQELVTVFTKSAIRIVGVAPDSLKLVRNIDYKGVVTGLRRSSFALVSNLESYDLIDLDNILKIPLVPVVTGSTATSTATVSLEQPETTESTPSSAPNCASNADDSSSIDSSMKNEHSATIKPLIVAVDKNEFLIATGSKAEEPAVGIIVNTGGDITRGTIAWPCYPSHLAVDQSCVIAVVGTQILINSLSDQTLIQTINFDKPPLLASVYTPFKAKNSVITEKLSTVVLTGKEPDAADAEASEQQQKQKHIEHEDISSIGSSIMVYSSEGLQCLLPAPESSKIEDLVYSGDIDAAKKRLEKVPETATAELEYYNHLMALACLLKGDYQEALTYWLNSKIVDPRILLYLLTEELVQGTVWIPKGAHPLIVKLKSKYQSDPLKTDESLVIFYNYVLDEWLKRKDWNIQSHFGTFDPSDLILSIRLAKLRLILDDNYHINSMLMLSSDFNNFISSLPVDSIPLVEPLFQEYQRFFDLSRLYRAHHMDKEMLEIWSKLITHELEDSRFLDGEEKMFKYLIHLDNKDLVWEYGLWLVEQSPKYGLKVFTNPDAHVKFDDADIVSALKALDNDVPWRKYLRFLVYEKKSTLFVSDLIAFMLDDIVEKLTKSRSNLKAVKDSYMEYKELVLPKRTYLEYLKSHRDWESEETKEFMSLRLELCHLLGTDVYYDLQKTLSILETKDSCVGYLILERCIVYSRMGYTDKCIVGLLHELTDYTTALNYCVYGLILTSNDFPSSVKPMESRLQTNMFKILYGEFLKLEREQDRKACARMLLDKYGSRLDFDTVLTESPDNWSVEVLGDYLVNVFRVYLKEKNETNISKSLARSENRFVTKQLSLLNHCIDEGKKKVVIDRKDDDDSEENNKMTTGEGH